MGGEGTSNIRGEEVGESKGGGLAKSEVEKNISKFCCEDEFNLFLFAFSAVRGYPVLMGGTVSNMVSGERQGGAHEAEHSESIDSSAKDNSVFSFNFRLVSKPISLDSSCNNDQLIVFVRAIEREIAPG